MNFLFLNSVVVAKLPFRARIAHVCFFEVFYLTFCKNPELFLDPQHLVDLNLSDVYQSYASLEEKKLGKDFLGPYMSLFAFARSDAVLAQERDTLERTTLALATQ